MKANLLRILYITGIVALIAGILDPLEGSVVITGGSLLLGISAWLKNDRHRKFFLISFVMITIGVAAMFYLSSLGGFGGTAELSWWWGLTILPYPVGWLMAIVLLIIRGVKSKKPKTAT